MKTPIPFPKPCLLALLLCGLALSTPASDYSQLFGVTEPVSGQSTFVQIDPSNGQATTLFSFPLSFLHIGNMTYFPDSGQFVVCNTWMDETPRLALLNPKTHKVTEIDIVGFPSSIGHVDSVAYYPVLNTLVLTCGQAGSFVEDHLATVTISGQVTQISQALPFPDADYVAYNPATGLLNIVDLNSGPGVQAVTDPFGNSPTYSQVGPALGTDPNYDAPAFSSGGELFILYFTDQTLLSLSGQNFVTTGAFNNLGSVNGLSFGYVPPTFMNLQITNGAAIATLAGLSSNQTVIFQSSTNLASWTSIQTNLATGPALSITNRIDPTIPAQFFRVVVPD